MTATPLPVPTLDETLRRLLRAASAIVDAGTLAATERAAARFREGNGPWLQAALEDFARQEHDAGRSWLSEAWFSGYFRGRGPLALGSNVSFQLAFPAGPGDDAPPSDAPPPGTASDAAALSATPPPGVDRAARILHRIAAVHLAQAGGRTAPEVDARDNALSMDQWAALNGGLRHPREDADAFLPCELDAASREVGILHRGRLFAVPVSDDAGRQLPARRLAELLGDVVGTAGGAPRGVGPRRRSGTSRPR
ncbi:choline/carnitine O-acyltransferase [Rothia sp. AR01]|uniref:Choline/carnitine O-acyltransferase n=1 Tax=Rothia santali TaxID=2949643 RepID=A0A9X2KH15_9MICC|nr:choline/carnitine O-acyltransferase [Rothia santali]MCP3424733.1 choline/carnitine O-acyltransferase [Rothia santali]